MSENCTSDEELDFSASEDEWVPNRSKKQSSSSESEEDKDDLEDFVVEPTKKRKFRAVCNRKTKKCLNNNKSILKKKKLKNDDSDSSSDEYLVDPKDIDLSSVFYNILPKEMLPVPTKKIPSNILPTQDDTDVAGPSNPNDFGNYQRFAKNLEIAKDHLKQLNPNTFGQDENNDVKQLLALGEMAENTVTKMDQEFMDDSENDDWEEVEEKNNDDKTKDVEIAINSGKKILKNSNRLTQFEGVIKNKLNKRKRNSQQILHKVNLLCLIGYGNHINDTINHPKLMEMCRTLLPSYEPKHINAKINLKHLKQLLIEYHKNMKLKEKTMNPKLKKLPPLATSLAIQINDKKAICIRDYVLIFIILLRAYGVQCRFVMNLNTIPIRPKNSELSALKLDSSEALHDLLKNDGKLITEQNTLNINDRAHWNEIADLLVSDKNKIEKELSSIKGISCTTRNTKKPMQPSSESETKDLNKINKNVENKIEKTSDAKSIKPKSVLCIKLTDIMKSKQLPAINLVKSKGQTDVTSEKSVEPNTVQEKRITRKRKSVSFQLSANTDDTEIPKYKIKSNDSQLSDRHTRRSALKMIKNLPAQTKVTKKLNTSPTTNSPQFKKKDENTTTTDVTKPKTRQLSAMTKKNDKSATRSKKQTSFIPQLDGGNDIIKSTRQKRSCLKSNTKPVQEKCDNSSDTDDSAFEPQKKKSKTINENKTEKNTKLKTTQATKNTALMSECESDDSDFEPVSMEPVTTKSKKNPKPNDKPNDVEISSKTKTKKENIKSAGQDVWIEIYCESKWMPIDVTKKGNISKIDDIRKKATKPITYVYAWNNNGTIRDVSTRYCSHWNQISRTKRVDQKWLDKALARYVDTSNEIDDEELNEKSLHKQLPTVISEYKNHPLYVLKRHLLKFEAIYPKNPLTLGFIRHEAVYSRDCVHLCQSRKMWMREARVVKPGENAYKVVLDRPKWDAATRTILKPVPMDIYGIWQTDPFEPPIAKNGIVPRNEYGNVEIFKPEMVPKNTVHIKLPGINRTCRKLGVDCAPAYIGYDWSKYKDTFRPPPPFDGYIICKEFEENVIKQYYEDREEAERKDEEKRNQRIYGNWKKLIKGLLIRERLQRKYDFKKK